MRLLKIRRMETVLDSGQVAACLVVNFSAGGVKAHLARDLPDGWDGWSRQEKVQWVKQTVTAHLLDHTYKEPGDIVFPDGALPDSAKDGYEGLPGWADWTVEQAAQWIEDNVTNLASAKTALKAMAKALCYLRDVTIER